MNNPNPNDIVIKYIIEHSGRAIYQGEQAQAIRDHMRDYPDDTLVETIDCLVAIGLLDGYPEEMGRDLADYEYHLVEWQE